MYMVTSTYMHLTDMLMHDGACTIRKAYLKASKLSSSRGLGVGYKPNCFDSVFCIAGVLPPFTTPWLSMLCCLVRSSPTTVGEDLSLCIVKA